MEKCCRMKFGIFFAILLIVVFSVNPVNASALFPSFPSRRRLGRRTLEESFVNSNWKSFFGMSGDRNRISDSSTNHSNFLQQDSVSANPSRSHSGVNSTLLNTTIDHAAIYVSWSEDRWHPIGADSAMSMWSCKETLRYPGTNAEAASIWPVYKVGVRLASTPSEALNFLLDHSKVQLVNQYAENRSELERFDENTCIVWSRMKMPFPIKSYDFCSLMHWYKNTTDGSYWLVSTGVEHPAAKFPTPRYQRCHTYLGVTRLLPLPNGGTELVSINHVSYPGASPFLLKANAFRGAKEYYGKLMTALGSTLQ